MKALDVARNSLLCSLIVLVLAAPATAGLFGSVGRALGIGGDVGKALDFVDGLSPGAGGATDSILGAPANAAFGTAINKWSDANDKTIDKLGVTNDRTVAKLIQGLEGVQAAISADVDSLNYAITAAVSSLDDALDKNIEKLDNSLTDQTQRLDTVFQKQVSTFFVLGRVLITVAIVGGFVFAVNRLILTASSGGGIGHQIRVHLKPIFIAVAFSALSILLTWLLPDPSRIAKIEDAYKKTYQRALRFEDFANAHTSAAQLLVLKPESSEYRAWTLKASAMRDLLLRPTTLLQEDKISSVYLKLGQVNYYRKDAGLAEDGDVAAVYGLSEGIRAKREIDYIAATISMLHARDLLLKDGDRPDQILDIKRATEEAAAQLISLSLPMDMLKFATQGLRMQSEFSEDARDSLVSTYEKAIGQSISYIPPNKAHISTASPASVRELGETLRQKLILRAFYRNLTAKYFSFLEAHLRAKTAGASAEASSDATAAFCALQRYYRDWHSENYRAYGANTAFVSGLLSGPFVLLARSHVLQGGGNACKAPLDELAVKTQIDITTQWVTPLTTVKLPSTSKGAALLKNAAKAVQDRQNESFAEFEKAFLALKDSTPEDRAKVALRAAEMAAVLGLYIEKNGFQIPAVHHLRVIYGTAASIEEWRAASRAFLESRLGT